MPMKALALASTLLCLHRCAFASGEKAPAWRDTTARAQDDLKQGHPDAAIRDAQAALAAADEDPGAKTPDVIHILAVFEEASMSSEFSAPLVEIQRRLTAIEPKNFEAWLALGRLLSYGGDFDGASQALDRALALQPDDRAARIEKAVLYSREGDFDRAIPALKALLSSAPRDEAYSLYTTIAQAYVGQGKLAEARDAFARAHRVDPRQAQAYIQEGYATLGQDDAASKAAFQDAVDIDTSSPLGYQHMGAYFATHGQLREAEHWFREAMARHRSSPRPVLGDMLDTYSYLGKVLGEEGRAAEAQAVLREGIGKSGDRWAWHANLLNELAQVYLSAGKPDKAQDALEEAVRICDEPYRCLSFGLPIGKVAPLGLARLYADRGKRAQALALADKMLARWPAEPRTPPDVQSAISLAELYDRLGETRKAASVRKRLPTERPHQ